MKAYVVDDQRAIVEILTQFLAEMGVESAGTTDPTHAHDAIAALHPDLILLDVMMPRLDGLTLLDELQADPRCADIPVVLCTASVLTPSQSSLFNDKGVGVLSKPFDFDQLQEIVDTVGSRQ